MKKLAMTYLRKERRGHANNTYLITTVMFVDFFLIHVYFILNIFDILDLVNSRKRDRKIFLLR